MVLITGTGGDDTLNGTPDADRIEGLDGDDILRGRVGNDTLNGGCGKDTAVYADTPAGYRFGNRVGDGRLTVTDINPANGNEGLDTLDSIEKIQFSDRVWTVTGEFQANTTLNKYQASSAVSAINGGFVVVWVADTTAGQAVYGQRYNSAGVATGGEFQVNTSALNIQYEPAIVQLAGGGFVVTWTAAALNGFDYDVYGQRYDAAGAAVGGEFLVNTTTTNSQYESAMTALTGGGFVVVWGADDADGSGIFGQRFSATGTKLGGEFRANTTTASYQSSATIAGLADGSFVVMWASYLQDGVDYGIYGQRYSAAGVAIGGEFQVNTGTTGTEYEPALTALDDGGFVAVWTSFTNVLGTVNSEVYGQRYNAAGVAVGGEFLVNTTTDGFQGSPMVTALGGGGFVVVWMTNDGYYLNIYGQRFNAAGVAVGDEFLVNNTTGSEHLPVVTAMSDGGFVVSWTAASLDGANIYGQRYDANGEPVAGATVQGSALGDVMNFSGSKVRIKLAGGLGDDSYVLGAAGDVIVLQEQADEGKDTVFSAKSYTLGANLENLTLTGSANINAIGNDLDNILTGNQGNNLLAGGEGKDTAVFSGAASDYRLARKPNGAITVSDNRPAAVNTGTDTLNSIETLKLADRVWTITEEFQVNTTTESYQFQPAITALADDGYVIVWESNEQDGSIGGIYGQRYNSAGVRLGGEFRINSTTAGSQYEPEVTALSDGGFVVVWTSQDQDGSNLGVYGQRYSRTGVKTGAEFRLNSTTLNSQQRPTITALNDGGFVAAWDSDGQDGAEFGVYGQRYTSAGVATGTEFRINSTTASSQSSPSLAGLGGGGFVAIWSAPLQEAGTRLGVYGQRYDSTGAAVGGEFKINTLTVPALTSIFQVDPSVTALSDGGFVVTWGLYGHSGYGYNIFGQRYSNTGAKTGDEFQINTTTTRYGASPIVTSLSDGGFVVTWGIYGQNGLQGDVYGQRYNASGAKTGVEFIVNNDRVGNQNSPAITALHDGGFIVAWTSSDLDGEGIYARRFDANGVAIPVIKGSGLDDVMNFADSIAAVIVQGAAGNDVLYGGSGDDDLAGGAGNDSVYAGSGNDQVYGGDGNDTLDGEAGHDVLYGDYGNDVLDGGAGNDTVYGGNGNDSIYAGYGHDTVYGNTGNDYLEGEAGSDNYVFGRGDGQDVIAEHDNTPGNTDVLSFLAGVARDQIWFKHIGNHLEVSIIGTTDKVTISDWYSGPGRRVETIRTAGGNELAASHVESLVSAMAGFASRPAGATTLTVAEHAALDGVIAANWS